MKQQLSLLADNKKRIDDEISGITSLGIKDRKALAQRFSKRLDGLNSELEVIDAKENELQGMIEAEGQQIHDIESLKERLNEFSKLMYSLPRQDAATICRLFFKKIEVRVMDNSEVQSESGGYCHGDGRIIFPTKGRGSKKGNSNSIRQKWIEVKVSLHTNVENDLIFTKESLDRIKVKLAFPRGFEPLYPP